MTEKQCLGIMAAILRAGELGRPRPEMDDAAERDRQTVLHAHALLARCSAELDRALLDEVRGE